MRYLSAASLLLLLTLPLTAADAPKPNTLTPQEVADGWLLLFDGETTFGWSARGEARAMDGALCFGGADRTDATTTSAFGAAELQYEWRQQGEGKAAVHFVMKSARASLTATVGGPA